MKLERMSTIYKNPKSSNQADKLHILRGEKKQDAVKQIMLHDTCSKNEILGWQKTKAHAGA